ncbi:MAG: hypothetical protein ATN36_08110 [Epulopiscium sp. Nele67-Bin005]|nr:MAG: hypothetical protein ATN36_08110 [Epulopiscium sp. Nele67-Bin005]
MLLEKLKFWKKEKYTPKQLEAKLLSDEIGHAQEELAVAMAQFENTTEPELLEYYTYYYKAYEIKHDYLLKRLKELYYR